ncbi:galectin-3 [Gadus macrocephalus]|uniref:galectin-3 n=1 Tax=Gadus macrocephalus TaxID=80720 RepID=UPI0028CB44E8|nr:galectin-3 [Gadus macrocephalus]
MDHPQAPCGGGCPPYGSASQGPPQWPGSPQQPQQQPQPQQQLAPSGASVWPGQAPPQAPPCWSGQPNTPCWNGGQPAPAPQPTFPGPYPASYPATYPAPGYQPGYPGSYPAPGGPMAPQPALAPQPAPTPASAPGQPCHPCWPGPQYQPQQPQMQPPMQPMQPPAPPPVPAPVSTPVPNPVPAPSPSPSVAPGLQPSVPGWPAPQSWNPGYNPGQPGWPGQNPSIMPPHWPLAPTSGPLSVPYNLNLSRGIYDKMMITIKGHVKPNAKMFTVNFLRGYDIPFHINPRFSEGGKQVLVRNHKVGERWGKEERDLKGPFPFAPGSSFEMKILCTFEAFRVAVNNIALFEFTHRVRELNQIDRINILHDVVLTYVNVETLP